MRRATGKIEVDWMMTDETRPRSECLFDGGRQRGPRNIEALSMFKQ
jgi:hypothetical protein